MRIFLMNTSNIFRFELKIYINKKKRDIGHIVPFALYPKPL